MRRRERGSAITEFALSSTVLILMVVGGTDLARIFNLSTSLTQAAKAGAQFASFSSQNAANTAGISAAALAAAPGVSATVSVQRTCYCGSTSVACGTAGACQTEPSMYSEVIVSASYIAFLPFWGSSSTIPMTGRARIRVK